MLLSSILALLWARGCAAPGKDATEVVDMDRDGYDAAIDCDDGDPTVHPDSPEVCDGVDQDCDGAVDEGATTSFYADTDGDGYGDAAAVMDACAAPEGWVRDDTDCDDINATVHPGADEVCDGVDQDCDGSIDDGVTSTFYADSDGDGYGDSSVTSDACAASDGWVADSSDCDDASAMAHPGADEVCDGLDDDCDGETDEGVTTVFYADADRDGYGNASVTINACATSDGWVADSSDCDDTSAGVNPAAAEICDRIDDDRDGSTDEGVTTTFYADADGDSYGDASVTSEGCAPSAGWVADATDCDDSTASTNPAATEACNGVDEDCHGTVDEGVMNLYYADADGDGYGAPSIYPWDIEQCPRKDVGGAV